MLLLALGLVVLRRPVDWGDVALWQWPLPAIRLPDGATYQAVISDGVGTARPEGRTHAGVDLCYRRRTPADLAMYPAGSSGGTRGFFAPPRVPVLAARDGQVWSVERTPRGIMIVLDHGRPWSSLYQHLATTLLPSHRRGRSVATGQPTRVKAGDVLGLMGADPMQGPRAFRHLHFEAHHEGKPIDPAGSMAQWPRATWAQAVT
jgi:murein DD-endopeptidase MepM/ murein hydrolase activator NlpD